MVPLSSSTPVKQNVVDATPRKTTIRVDSALLQKNKSPKTVVISKKGKSGPPPVYKAIQKQDMEKVKGFFQGHKVKAVSTATASGDPLFFQIVTVDEGQPMESALQGSGTSAHDQKLVQQLVSQNDDDQQSVNTLVSQNDVASDELDPNRESASDDKRSVHKLLSQNEDASDKRKRDSKASDGKRSQHDASDKRNRDRKASDKRNRDRKASGGKRSQHDASDKRNRDWKASDDKRSVQKLLSQNDDASDKLPNSSVVIKQEPPDTEATTPEQQPEIDYSSLLLKPGAAEAVAKALRNLSKHVSAIYISMHSSTSFEITLVKMLSL